MSAEKGLHVKKRFYVGKALSEILKKKLEEIIYGRKAGKPLRSVVNITRGGRKIARGRRKIARRCGNSSKKRES